MNSDKNNKLHKCLQHWCSRNRSTTHFRNDTAVRRYHSILLNRQPIRFLSKCIIRLNSAANMAMDIKTGE